MGWGRATGTLAANLETTCRIKPAGLYAHDLAGRAQAFVRLVSGGVEVDPSTPRLGTPIRLT